jgi:hypothetical protein
MAENRLTHLAAQLEFAWNRGIFPCQWRPGAL